MLAIARKTDGYTVAVGIDWQGTWHIWNFDIATNQLQGDHRTIRAVFETQAYSKHWRFLHYTENTTTISDLVPPFFGG